MKQRKQIKWSPHQRMESVPIVVSCLQSASVFDKSAMVKELLRNVTHILSYSYVSKWLAVIWSVCVCNICKYRKAGLSVVENLEQTVDSVWGIAANLFGSRLPSLWSSDRPLDSRSTELLLTWLHCSNQMYESTNSTFIHC